MNDDEFERMHAEMQHERETRMRELEVRRGDTTRSSGGVELVIEISSTTATVIDCNPAELRAWAGKMLAFADELDRPVHLMDDDLLDACGMAPERGGITTTPVEENVTCPACIRLIEKSRS